jgi:glycosyltransferase involved in cell wall biosynthesis
MPPKAAVITPTKDRLKLLCEAMDSVRAQTFEAWEHIIVDDGSDDGTAEEVRRRAESDLRICSSAPGAKRARTSAAISVFAKATPISLCFWLRMTR